MVQIIKATHEYRQVISNLLQFYIYDFSEFTGHDPDPSGLFGVYPDLENYWTDKTRFPYLIKLEEKWIGFVFVKFITDGERNYFSIAEFFIMRKYRRRGLGRQVAEQIFDLHEVSGRSSKWNPISLRRHFGGVVIMEYTKGQFSERVENKRTIQCFENHNPLG